MHKINILLLSLVLFFGGCTGLSPEKTGGKGTIIVEQDTSSFYNSYLKFRLSEFAPHLKVILKKNSSLDKENSKHIVARYIGVSGENVGEIEFRVSLSGVIVKEKFIIALDEIASQIYEHSLTLDFSKRAAAPSVKKSTPSSEFSSNKRYSLPSIKFSKKVRPLPPL